MSKPDGGPAFPHVADAMYQGMDGLITRQITNNGMTLRDYFAGQAMTNCPMNGCVDAAEWCYQRADAMLAERDKK